MDFYVYIGGQTKELQYKDVSSFSSGWQAYTYMYQQQLSDSVLPLLHSSMTCSIHDYDSSLLVLRRLSFSMLL